MRSKLHIEADEGGTILLLEFGSKKLEVRSKSRDGLLRAIMKLLKSARVRPEELNRIDLDVARASFSFSRAAFAIAKTFELIHGVRVGDKTPQYYGKPTISTPKKYARYTPLTRGAT